SPCYNDKCLFRTSLDPYPDPKEVSYNGDLQNIEEQNKKFFDLEYPTNDFIEKFAYIHAVDNDPLTCWNSFKAPQAGDSFGIQFVKATPLRKFTVTSSKTLAHLEGTFTVYASDHRAQEWVECRHYTKFPFVHTMSLDITCPSLANLPKGTVQNVKIQFDSNLEKSLGICGMDIGGMVL
ncbi:hypothetical protein BGZ76_003177, partial [Entomortierella beljakovae]